MGIINAAISGIQCDLGRTAMVTERARAQPAPSTMVARTYTMVAYEAFWLDGGGGTYSPSAVTCTGDKQCQNRVHLSHQMSALPVNDAPPEMTRKLQESRRPLRNTCMQK